MKFYETELKGAYAVELQPFEDHRGLFSRTFCKREFGEQGLKTEFVQCNLSFNHKKGTLRGMHYQLAPKAEVKYVYCMQGALYDVIIDLRPESPTFCKWFGIELNETERKMLYVPEGFAHGFQTLRDNTLAFYQVSEFYSPEQERGVRWNDPIFSIKWPLSDPILSEKDAKLPDFRP